MTNRVGQVWDANGTLILVLRSYAVAPYLTGHDVAVLDSPYFAPGSISTGWHENSAETDSWENAAGRVRLA